jgi:hypothetical protein
VEESFPRQLEELCRLPEGGFVPPPGVVPPKTIGGKGRLRSGGFDQTWIERSRAWCELRSSRSRLASARAARQLTGNRGPQWLIPLGNFRAVPRFWCGPEIT